MTVKEPQGVALNPGVTIKSGVILFGIAFVFLAANALAGQKKILVIHSYHEELPWTIQCNRGMDAVFPDDILVKRVYLDTKRIPESRFHDNAEAALDSFHRLQPDLVMLGDDNALRLLWKPLFDSGVPVVFFGINNNIRQYFDEVPANMTGVLERVPLVPWLRYLKEIIPGAVRALVLMDSSITSEAVRDASFGKRKTLSVEGVYVECKAVSGWNDWKRSILEPRGYDFIVLPVFHSVKDSQDKHVSVETLIRWTSANSSVPVFANQDYAVGDDGVVGAYVLRGEEHARTAATLALGVLDYKFPRLPLINSSQKGRFFFNRKQLQRFGLVLPSEIERRSIYRQPLSH